MTKEKKTQEIKGEVEGWSNEPRDFHSNNMGSRGVKIEGDWHNVLGKLDFLETLHEAFPKGSHIKFTEEENARGYWDVKGDIEKIEKSESYEPNAAAPAPNPNKDKNILFQVAFKGAVEVMKIFYQGVECVDLDKLEKNMLTNTGRIYKGLNELKLKLKESGEW